MVDAATTASSPSTLKAVRIAPVMGPAVSLTTPPLAAMPPPPSRSAPKPRRKPELYSRSAAEAKGHSAPSGPAMACPPSLAPRLRLPPPGELDPVAMLEFKPRNPRQAALWLERLPPEQFAAVLVMALAECLDDLYAPEPAIVAASVLVATVRNRYLHALGRPTPYGRIAAAWPGKMPKRKVNRPPSRRARREPINPAQPASTPSTEPPV